MIGEELMGNVGMRTNGEQAEIPEVHLCDVVTLYPNALKIVCPCNSVPL